MTFNEGDRPGMSTSICHCGGNHFPPILTKELLVLVTDVRIAIATSPASVAPRWAAVETYLRGANAACYIDEYRDAFMAQPVRLSTEGEDA